MRKVSLSLLVLLSGCVDAGPPVVAPPPPPVYGPPAIGQPCAPCTYYYYPGPQVYFCPPTGVHFFLEGGHWRLGASLPAVIQATGLGGYVALSLNTDRP